MWEHYKAIEDENFHLKQQLRNKNKTISNMRASYSALNKKYKKLTDNQKPKFRNNGKGGK